MAAATDLPLSVGAFDIQGAPVAGRKGHGDEYAEVYIVPPPFDNERVREMMKELESLSGPNPRQIIGMN